MYELSLDRAQSLDEKLCHWYVGLGRTPGYRHPRLQSAKRDTVQRLSRHYPDLLNLIQGKRVIDFGCDTGKDTVALAEAGAEHVLGVEILPVRLAQAEQRLTELVGTRAEGRVSFCQAIGSQHAGAYDLMISINSMEHFADPDAVLRDVHSALRPGGMALFSFGPPWFSAYGPHQLDYTKMPWPHLLFSERTLMQVRGRLTNQPNVRTYADRGLNQMTIAKFERVMARSEFDVASVRYQSSKGMGVLAHLPLIRELAVNRITCCLIKA